MRTTNRPHHQRITSVFNGTWPDRIPACQQAFASSVASKILGRQVYTGSTDVWFAEALAWLDGDQAHEDFLDQLFQDTVELHRVLDLDIFFLPWRWEARPTKRVDDVKILYGDPETADWEIYRFDPASRTYGLCQSSRPEATYESVLDEMRRTVERGPQDPAPSLSPLLLRALREVADDWLVAGGAGMAIPMKAPWLEATVLEPGLIADYLDVAVESNLAAIRTQHKAGIRLINGGGDFAFNSGPIYSPKFFHDVMLPRWTKLFNLCRELGLWYVMRSDGDLWPVADDLFGTARPHAYYEVDYEAGMRFDLLRRRFPDLVLIGNVSCDLLCRGTAEAVRRQMIACLDAAAPRVIASSSNCILHGTPPENVLALHETARTYRTGRQDRQ